MKTVIKKSVCIFLVLIMIFSVSGCGNQNKDQLQDDMTATNDLPETNDSDFTLYESGKENVSQDMESGNSYVNNEILITLDSADSENELEMYLSDIGGKIVGGIPAIADYQILLDKEYTYDNLLMFCSDLKQEEWVISASLNYILQSDPGYIPNDEQWINEWSETPDGSNWGLEAISAQGAWDYTDDMQSVNIGIIDTMFATHSDLTFAETPLGMNEVYSLIEKNKLDWCDHGTHTAGTVAANFDNNGICGIVPKRNLYGVAVHGYDILSVQLWKIAFYYLIATNSCKVINISLGYDELCFNASRNCDVALSTTETYASVIADYLQILIDLNYQFVICKCAGNQNEVGGAYKYFKKDADDTNTPFDYYSYADYKKYLDGEDGYDHFDRYKDRQKEIESRLESGNVSADCDVFAKITNQEVKDRIIIVGAVKNKFHEEAGFLGFNKKRVHDGYEIAEFSQCGEAVDILAPGVDIYSTIKNGYDYKDGTSMATPHVSGIAGLVFAINPDIKSKTVKEIICNSAVGEYGAEKYGLLNAENAVKMAKDYTPDSEETEIETETKSDSNTTSEVLLNNIWYNNIQSLNEYHFSEDGTVVTNPDFLPKTYSYTFDGTNLTIIQESGKKTILKYVSKKDNYNWNADLFFYNAIFNEISEDEKFFYEIAWVDNETPSANVMWLRVLQNNENSVQDEKETTSQAVKDIYPEDILTLSGTLVEKYTFKGNAVYVLELDQPIVVNFYSGDTFGDGTDTSLLNYTLTEIQCNFNDKSEAKSYLSDNITVTGMPMRSHTAHHLTKIVLTDCII